MSLSKLKNKIYVTRPYLPPIDEYMSLLSDAWENRWLTNEGKLHFKLEEKLCNYLNVKHISLFNNATIALLVAQKALNFKNEIITTPFSFIATTHSIKWNGLEPIFVDTDDYYGNMDPQEIEKNIDEKTGGILAVHNYGLPGRLNEVEEISKRYDVPLIYDAAPAIGVKLNGDSVLNYGDLSILSFHATKVFTTFEGGAIISRSKEMKLKIDQLKNFAIVNEETIDGLGINGKMNEAEAAMGLLQLKYLEKNISKRKEIFYKYKLKLDKFNYIKTLDIKDGIEYNFGYFPIFFKNGFKEREKVYGDLYNEGIYCRKYWFPLISSHNLYKNSKKTDLSNSEKLSNTVLCLPIYPDLSDEDMDRIVKILAKK